MAKETIRVEITLESNLKHVELIEVIAQTVAEHLPERAVAAWSIPIRFVRPALAPIRPIAAFFAELVRRLAGGPSRSEAEAIEAELLSVRLRFTYPRPSSATPTGITPGDTYIHEAATLRAPASKTSLRSWKEASAPRRSRRVRPLLLQ